MLRNTIVVFTVCSLPLFFCPVSRSLLISLVTRPRLPAIVPTASVIKCVYVKTRHIKLLCGQIMSETYVDSLLMKGFKTLVYGLMKSFPRFFPVA